MDTLKMGRSISFVAGMAIDADGAPNAYHANNIGSDDLANAGYEGHWWGLAINKATGKPYIQTGTDPCPGYYVSTTSLVNPLRDDSEPARYVDSNTVPYIALGSNACTAYHMAPGAIARVEYRDLVVLAVLADIGPSGKWGEGSIALANALGIPSSPRNGGLEEEVVRYTIFNRYYPASEIRTDDCCDLSVLSHWSSYLWPDLRARVGARVDNTQVLEGAATK